MAGPGKHSGVGELTTAILNRPIGTVTYRLQLDPSPDGTLLCYASLVPAAAPADPIGTAGDFRLTIEDGTTVDLSLELQERNGRTVYCGTGRVRAAAAGPAAREASVA